MGLSRFNFFKLQIFGNAIRGSTCQIEKFVSKLKKPKNKLLKLALIVSKPRRKINQEKWRISTTKPKLDNKTSSLSFSPPNLSEKVIRTKSVIKYPMPSSMPILNKIPTPKSPAKR